MRIDIKVLLAAAIALVLLFPSKVTELLGAAAVQVNSAGSRNSTPTPRPVSTPRAQPVPPKAGVPAPQQEQQPTQVYCEDVPAGSGIVPCQWRDAGAAASAAEATRVSTEQLWTDMADEAVEGDYRADPLTPTAEVPTECSAPPNERAKATCELIKRGILHPKG